MQPNTIQILDKLEMELVIWACNRLSIRMWGHQHLISPRRSVGRAWYGGITFWKAVVVLFHHGLLSGHGYSKFEAVRQCVVTGTLWDSVRLSETSNHQLMEQGQARSGLTPTLPPLLSPLSSLLPRLTPPISNWSKESKKSPVLVKILLF